MKKLIQVSIWVSAVTCTYGQDTFFMQSTVNPYIINPAVAGIDGYWNIKTSVRYHWTGIENAPRSYYLSAHGAINKGKIDVQRDEARARQGVGTFVSRDEAGPVSNTTLSLSYAYHVALTEKLRLSAGIGVGMNQFKVNVNELTFGDPDPIAGKENLTSISPAFNLGLWLKNDHFFSGIAMYQTTQDGAVGKTSIWTYIITAGYHFPIREHITLIPAVLIRLKNTTQQTYEFNTRFMYKDVAWAGVSYRYDKTVAIMTGFTILKKFDISYALDFPSNKISEQRLNNGHEVLLGIQF